jgi:hypothetical protein
MIVAHITSKHTPLTTNEQNELACRRATQDSPGSSSLSQARRGPESSQDMYMQPSPVCNELKSVAMKSAHERAAYLRPHPSTAVVQRQAAELSESQQSSGRSNEGALRQRSTRAMRTQEGRSLPDAAAAAALTSSAAARRTERHRRATSRQLRRTKVVDLMKRLATNTHTHAFSSHGSSNAWSGSSANMQQQQQL